MSAKILDGKELAQTMREEMKLEIEQLQKECGHT